MDDVLEVETDPVILRRYFPVEATVGGGLLIKPALVIVTRERVYVWRAPDDLITSAVWYPVEFDGQLPREYELRHRPLLLDTGDGRVAVNKAHGCGCGNPLKSFRPFQPARTANR